VLKAIDEMNLGVWQHTICYSTVSGGSVGTYNYIKGREIGEIADTDYLRYLYQKNYNSSGVYGLLIGDAIETLFGPLATTPKGWICGDTLNNSFYDRNVRIRQEYDYVLQEALTGNQASDYVTRTFYPWFTENKYQPDSFETYYLRRRGQIPIT
jgi:hypothetical protein